MSLLYAVLLILMFGGAAVWVFTWAIENRSPRPARKRENQGLISDGRREKAELARPADRPEPGAEVP